MTYTQALAQDPLFVGFDRIFDRMHQINSQAHKTTNYPPYNIVRKGENHYNVELAVAGWKEEDICIEVEKGELKVEGIAPEKEDSAVYLHKGIGLRSFKRTFQLADTVVVRGAHLAHGMLSIELENVIPEEMKPRKIEISKAPPLTLDSETKPELLTEQAA